MGALLQTYLPLVIFIGIAFVISAALLISPVPHCHAQARSGEGLGL